MQIDWQYEYVIDEALSDTERAFKEYYLSHPELHLDQAHPFAKTRDLIQQIMSENQDYNHNITDVLIESNYISPNSTVHFNLHIRYLPANYHRHTFFEICYLLKGSCKNYSGEEIIDMKAGDILIIAPNTEHAISAFTDDCIIINLLLRKDTFEQNFFQILNEKDTLATFLSKALQENKLNKFLLFRNCNEPIIHYYFIKAYEQFLQHSRFKDQLLNALIQTFFVQVLLLHEKDIIIYDDNGITADKNIIFILRYIQEHYRDISLSQLSKFFGYSERHMRRLLQEHTGLGFSDMIQNLRMQQAQNLLKDPMITVSSVAEIVGYGEVSHFRRLFKNHFGVTPAEYRNQFK